MTEQTRAALLVVALGGAVLLLFSHGAGKARPRKGTKRSKARTGKPTVKSKRFDGKGYSFAGSHQYKADATKAAESLRKQGKSARVTPFRWSANSKPQWGVFVR